MLDKKHQHTSVVQQPEIVLSSWLVSVPGVAIKPHKPKERPTATISVGAGRHVFWKSPSWGSRSTGETLQPCMDVTIAISWSYSSRNPRKVSLLGTRTLIYSANGGTSAQDDMRKTVLSKQRAKMGIQIISITNIQIVFFISPLIENFNQMCWSYKSFEVKCPVWKSDSSACKQHNIPCTRLYS
jgi:hypothetical protein